MSKYRYTITLINPVKNEDGFYHVYLDDHLIKFERLAQFEFTTLEELSNEDIKFKLRNTEHKYSFTTTINTLYKDE